MAFCTRCGAPLPDGARFCTKCGAPVPRAQSPQPGKPVVQSTPEGIVIDVPPGSTVTVSDAPQESTLSAPAGGGEFILGSWNVKIPKPAQPAQAAQAPQKKKKLPLLLIVLGLLVLILLIILL